MLNLAAGLARQGVLCRIFVLKNGHNPHVEVAEAAAENGLSCDVIECGGRFDFGAVSRMAGLLKKNNIDILHTHNYKSDFLGLLAVKKIGIPIVATLHGYIGDNFKVRFYEAIDRSILKFFSRVVFVDRSLEKWFPGAKFNYEVINNGISAAGIDEPRQEDKIFRVGTVGRLSREKGQGFLIEAFSRFISGHPDAELVIVGDGPDSQRLKSQVSNLGLGKKVIFAGFQKDVAPYYKKMDVFILPSLLEHCPLSVLEAMSFGKAVAATKVGGVPELIRDGETGYVVAPGSSEEIYQVLLKLAADSSLRIHLGQSASSFVKKHYSVEKMVESYLRVYQAVSR
ncbi:MAG: glycosyltransferase family 4 protein [Candidatus Omnitrophica bacterium]|nr:glycosyltransferase family 4 protein [Candidatus Omnitrophota bacterium]